MITNIYEGETVIEQALLSANIVPSQFIILNNEVDKIDGRIFKSVTPPDRVGIALNHAGFRVISNNRREAVISIEYVISVLTQRDSYKTIGGRVLIEAIRAIKSAKLPNSCKGFNLKDDVHEFNRPAFYAGLVALPFLISHEVVL